MDGDTVDITIVSLNKNAEEVFFYISNNYRAALQQIYFFSNHCLYFFHWFSFLQKYWNIFYDVVKSWKSVKIIFREKS